MGVFSQTVWLAVLGAEANAIVGAVDTVTFLTAVLSAQPSDPATVYEIVDTPAELPRINPVKSTIATALLDELHVPPGGVAVNTVHDSTQIP